MLVIVVVAAGMATVAVVFLRSRHTHRPAAAPTSSDLRRGAAAQSDNSASQPQGGQPEDTCGRGLPEPARSRQPESAAAERAVAAAGADRAPVTSADNTDLEFTLEVPDSGASAPTDVTFTMPALQEPDVTSVQSRAGGGFPSLPAQSDPRSPEGPQVLTPAEVFTRLYDLALGKARPASGIHADHANVAATVGTLLGEAATQDRYAPRRPNMLPKILSASNDDTFSRRELAALIARDPSLVGNLLKIANSSYYRVTAQPVESVDRAVVLLGTDGIRSLVTAALMQPIFRIGCADFPRFPDMAWEYTFRAANAAVPYNFLTEKSDPFAAELLSLVMGLAHIVIFRVAMDQYAKNLRLRPDAGVVSSLLDAHAAGVARRIGASWELSETTLSGLDGQTISTNRYPTALGRSVYFGRVAGALAVLRINDVIDDDTGKASVPATGMSESQLDRMWTRLTYKLDKH
jgi:hypothetical protein